MLQGQAPVLEAIGPFAFRRYIDRMQAQWSDSDEGQVVEYIEWKHWGPAPAGTRTRDPSEIIVNMNPGYFGALASAGGELKLSLAMISAVVVDIIRGLSDSAVPATRIAFAIRMMSEQVQSILADPRMNGNMTLFEELWSWSTVPPWNSSSDWNMLLPGQQTGRPLSLSMHSASLLWNSSVRASIANTSPDSVLALQRASLSPDSLSKWADAFGIGHDTAALLLLDWLPLYMCSTSDPKLCKATGVSSDCGCSQDAPLRDTIASCGRIATEWKLPCSAGKGALTWQQFAQGTVGMEVWNAPSMIDVFPSVFPGSSDHAPELSSYLRKRYVRCAASLLHHNNSLLDFVFNRLPTFSVQTDVAVQWLSGDCGLADPTNILEWAQASVLDPAVLQRCYNMSLSTAADLNFYLVFLYNFASKAYAETIFAQNGGVKRQQSAFDWLFNTVDPLLHRLSPSQADISFFKNLSWEQTRRAALVDAMYTGKGEHQNAASFFSIC